MATNKTTYGNGHGATGNSTLLEMPYLCTVETCDITTMGQFSYAPNLGANVFFAVIFGLCLVAQLFFGVKHKTWGYMSAMVLGLLLEIVGYVGRVMLHNNPFNNDAFLQYLVTLTIAPALLTAAIYLCLGRIINVYGPHLSYFKPRTYTLVFCTFDLICLILQAAGGAIASTSNVRSTTEIGRKIMIAGILFQVFALTLFIFVSSFYFLNVFRNRSSRTSHYANITSSLLFKSFLVGLVVAVITIQTRSIYRVVELWDGFNSDLFRGHEVTFIILESVMIMIAALCLTVLHPAVCFQGAWHDANFSLRNKEGTRQTLKSSDEEGGNIMEMRRGDHARV